MPETSSEPSMPEIGQPFNPYGLYSIHIPLGLLTYPARRVSWAAKALYGRLAFFRGPKPDGICNPSLEKIAGAMGGVDIATVDRWLKELISEGFIQRKRRRRETAEIVFLAHPALVNTLGLDSARLRSQGGLDSATSRARLRKNDNQDSANLPPAYIGRKHSEENIQENSSSAAVEVPTEAEPAEPNDDDTVSMKEKTEAGTDPRDLEALVDTAREQLRLARASGLRGYAIADDVKLPDRTITERILGTFQDSADFTAWLEDTIRRGLARQARDPRWGLYLTDAKMRAEDIAIARQKAEKQRRDYAEIQREREQAAEATAAELDTPMPWLQAHTRLMATFGVGAAGWQQGREVLKVPQPLKLRLERMGGEISPNRLAQEIRGWRRCPTCSDHGTVGNALQKNLAFCGCVAGEEAQHSNGDGWPVAEIARVHATAQSVIVAAFHDLGASDGGQAPDVRWLFMADAIEAAAVIDDGAKLTINLTPTYVHSVVKAAHVKVALERAGLVREVSIRGGIEPAQISKPAPSLPPMPEKKITEADFEAYRTERRKPAAGGLQRIKPGPGGELLSMAAAVA